MAKEFKTFSIKMESGLLAGLDGILGGKARNRYINELVEGEVSRVTGKKIKVPIPKIAAKPKNIREDVWVRAEDIVGAIPPVTEDTPGAIWDNRKKKWVLSETEKPIFTE